jgi:cysteine desulfurase
VREVYLDYNGSAPLDPRVAEAMIPFLASAIGNASSVHRYGRRQAALVDEARDQVARLVGARSSSAVVFTAGATEANNLALRGAVEAGAAGRPRLLISAVEHASVRNTARHVSERGMAKIDIVPVTAGGHVESDTLESLLGDDVLLVSVMAANSETGVLNPIAEIAERVHHYGALLHCDATQMVGRLPFNMNEIGADLVSVSSHKICGPGGVGALIGTRQSLRQIKPIIHGGGHERGLRSGSLNVTGIVGFGVAARIAAEEHQGDARRIARLRDHLVRGLRSRLESVEENGDLSRRLPNTANVRFVGADAEAVMANMDAVAVAAGSACSSGSIEPSEVLLAMGISRDAAFEAIRLSLGRFTTEQDIAIACDSVVGAVEHVRTLNRESA